MGGRGRLTFAPADRITYNLSQTWALAVEHYADYGSFANLAPLGRQYHALFGVIDYTSDPLNLEFGIGHGFTAVSESLILKLDSDPQFLGSEGAHSVRTRCDKASRSRLEIHPGRAE